MRKNSRNPAKETGEYRVKTLIKYNNNQHNMLALYNIRKKNNENNEIQKERSPAGLSLITQSKLNNNKHKMVLFYKK